MLSQAVPFLAVRWRSVANKIRRMASHWPGRIVLSLLTLATARLAWVYVQAPAPGSTSLVAPRTALTTLGLLSAAACVVLGLRAVARPPIVLAIGDLTIVDSGAFVRPAVVAGLAARVMAPATLSFLVVPLAVSVSPLVFPTVGSRIGAWLVLTAFGTCLTMASVLTSCVAWGLTFGVRWARAVWWMVGVSLAGVLTGQALVGGEEGIYRVGGFVISVLHAAPLTVAVLSVVTLAMAAGVVALADRMIPVWATSLYQAAAILDLASTNDVTGALALSQQSQTKSQTFPTLFAGPLAYLRRQHIEATRRRMKQGLLAQYAAGLAACWGAARYQPDLWWLVFLALGGFAAAVCAQDGALYESRYPFFMFGAGGLGARCLWASTLSAARMYGFMTVTLLGGGLGSPGRTPLTLAFGCAIGWPIFASACSSAAAILTTRGGSGRLCTSAASIASLGGSAAYGIGLVASRFLDPLPAALVPALVLAAGTWIVLYLAWSTTSAPNHVLILRD